MKNYINKNYWDNLYKASSHKSIWPWNDVIKLIKKNYKSKNKNILELGCGYGANIPFLINENFKYYGLDSSQVAISQLKKKFKKIRKNIILSDISSYNFKKLKKKFGIILDRGTITHIDDDKIVNIVEKLKTIIEDDSILIFSSLYSTKCTDYIKKKKNFFNSGIFNKVGFINFFSKQKILKIFKDWSILVLEEVSYKDHKKNKIISYWNLVIRK